MEFILRVAADTEKTPPRAVIFQDEISVETRKEIFSSLQPGVYRYVNDPSLVVRSADIQPALPTADDIAKLLPTMKIFEDDGRHAQKKLFTEPRAVLPMVETLARDKNLPRRNDLCPCGSGKKFKKCHGQA